MYWQRELFRNGATWANGGTYRLELPDHGLLGSIMFHAYRGGVTDSMVAIEKWRLLDYISKLEIIGDGSQLIKSFTGRMGHFLQWLDGGGAAPDQQFNYGSSTKRHHSMIHFGRKLFDKEYGLDLAKWKSVELQFTNDGSSTYFGGDWSIDVILYWLREPTGGQFKGYFRTEEWRSWTTVADEIKYLELPTRGLMRRLVLQADADVDATMNAETQAYNVIYNIELLIRSGQLKVFDMNLRHLWYENYLGGGRDVIQAIQPYHTQDYGIRTGLAQSLGYAGCRIPHDGTQDTATPSLTPGQDNSTLARMTDTDADQDSLLVMGLGLENCSVIPFDQSGEVSDYLDLNRDGTVELNVTTRNASSAADGTIKAVIDRLIT